MTCVQFLRTPAGMKSIFMPFIAKHMGMRVAREIVQRMAINTKLPAASTGLGGGTCCARRVVWTDPAPSPPFELPLTVT